MKIFTLPDVGEGLTEADLVNWMVKVGDTVTVNQVVAEIETAKSLVEIPSPWAGVVKDLFVEVGDIWSTWATTSSPSKSPRAPTTMNPSRPRWSAPGPKKIPRTTTSPPSTVRSSTRRAHNPRRTRTGCRCCPRAGSSPGAKIRSLHQSLGQTTRTKTGQRPRRRPEHDHPDGPTVRSPAPMFKPF